MKEMNFSAPQSATGLAARLRALVLQGANLSTMRKLAWLGLSIENVN